MIELQEILSIAEKVNRKNYDQVRLRLKTLEIKYPELTFEETIELQFLLMKIITPQ